MYVAGQQQEIWILAGVERLRIRSEKRPDEMEWSFDIDAENKDAVSIIGALSQQRTMRIVSQQRQNLRHSREISTSPRIELGGETDWNVNARDSTLRSVQVESQVDPVV
jgi:hypothetical protein